MMDGITPENNLTDNGMDLWNSHVTEVERTADALTDGDK